MKELSPGCPGSRGRLARAVTSGAVLAGFAAAALLASPAANAATGDVEGSHDYIEVSNYTSHPYSFYEATNSPYSADFNVDAEQIRVPQAIQAGQTTTWDAAEVANPYDVFFFVQGASLDAANADSTAFGVGDRYISSGTHGVYTETYSSIPANFRQTHRGDTWTQGDDKVRLVPDPDGDPEHVDLVEAAPTTVTIDNDTDPTAAAAAVSYQFPRAVDGSVNWMPNMVTAPMFSVSNPVRATSMVYNYSSEPATLGQGHETTKGEKTSLGAEVTGSVGVKAFGVAAKVAASFTSEADWDSSDSMAVNVDAEIEPGHTGWLDKVETVATLAGDLQFTTPEGVTFKIHDVSISKGDLVDPSGSLKHPPVSYMPDEQAITAPAGQ